MNKVLLFSALCVLCLNSYSQRTCATHDHMQHLQSQHPEIAEERKAIEEFTQNFVANYSGEKSTNAVITIPVVVHILYKNSTENLSDSRIQSQIDVLNQDFRRTNADASNTPSVWQNIAADCEIEFCLATIDPQGNPTNGITRTSTNVSSFSIQSDNIKFSSQGGKDAWPRNQYLNIWVGSITGGILGYALQPGAPASIDGVVIGYQYFGGPGTGAQSPYNRGRTATHEVGHWLNLDHIWGDDGGSCSGTDNVSDTPNQADENGGCPSFPRTDACSPSAPGVMFMNYMDYVNDNCMNMFTAGQKARMLAALNGPRSSLLTANKCTTSSGPGGGCDTLSNWTSGDQPVLLQYGGGGSGYLGGHNSYQDMAKAEKFTNVGSNKVLTKVIYGFGAVNNANANSVITCTVWGNNGGSPGSELASVTVSAQSVATHVSNSQYSLVTFPNPSVNGTFFAGIKMSYSTSLQYALITSSDGDQSPATAWEQWSNNTWAQFGTNGATEADLSLAVFPIVCDALLGTEEVVGMTEPKIFPNPTDGIINYIMPDNASEWTLKVYDMMGRLQTVNILSKDVLTGQADLSQLPGGMYVIEISSLNKRFTEKIILRK